MNILISWLKKSKKNGLAAFAVLVVGAGVLGLAIDTLAINSRVNVVEDGGGGGGDYSYPRVRIPEITPSREPADLEVQDTFTGTVDADESYNVQMPGTYWYAWNRFMSPSNGDSAIQGYVTALGQPNITIGYKVGVFDAETDAPIERGSTVAVGKKIKLVFGEYVPDDIFWFGTGYSMDSPYGEWRANAAPPARVGGKVTCESKDFTAKYFLPGYNMTFDVYIPFVVNPPARSITNIPSNLSCDPAVGGGLGEIVQTCTVTGPGAIEPKFRFEATYGKFYYRYYDYRNMGGSWGGPGCYGNNIPLTTEFGVSNGPAYNNVKTIKAASQVSIPLREIPYALNGGEGSNPPGTPTLVCPASSVDRDENVIVTIQATDPDGDQIRYGIDWIDDGTNEVNGGWTELVSSGSPASFTKTGGYSTSGEKTVHGIAEDATGTRSVWGSCTVSVDSAPECSDSSDNDGDGLNNYPADPGCTSDGDDSEDPNPGPAPSADLTADPSTVVAGNTTTLRWTSENADSCTGAGFSTGGDASGTAVVGPITANTNYQITCRGSGGAANDTANVLVTNPMVSITADPDRVSSGGSSNISWTSSECANVEVSGTNGFTAAGPSGTDVPSGPIKAVTTFTVTCDGGVAEDEVIVNLPVEYEEF